MIDLWEMVFWTGLFHLYKVGFTPKEITQMGDEMGLNTYMTKFMQENVPKVFDEELLLLMPSKSKYFN